jgi:mRNA interferase YafQ
MKTIKVSTRFKKDLRSAHKRGLDIDKLDRLVTRIAADDVLEPRYRLHRLSGDYAGYWECHIEPDWLLVFSLDRYQVYLYRTGTHADLFD